MQIYHAVHEQAQCVCMNVQLCYVAKNLRIDFSRSHKFLSLSQPQQEWIDGLELIPTGVNREARYCLNKQLGRHPAPRKFMGRDFFRQRRGKV